MLDAAFESWIGTLEERDFDDTFVSLLRGAGYQDIHFTHGSYEFGKDFIAKLPGTPSVQFAFQCKAGDIGGGEWDRLFAQLDQLTGTSFTHPNYDPRLQREFVLVTTGRLTGKAILCARDFGDRLAEQSRGHFRVWDCNSLKELLQGGASGLPASPVLSPVLGRVAGGDLEDRELESLLAPLIPALDADNRRVFRALLDNAIVTVKSLSVCKSDYA